MFNLRMPVLLVMVVLLAGCGVGTITGSGNVVTQEESFADFDRLEVSHGFQVEVQQGSSFSVVISADDNLLEYVQVAKQGGILQIGIEPGRTYNFRDATLEADVTMPDLSGLDLSGGSHVTLNDFSLGKALVADLSGGSHLRGDVEAGDATFELSGGSWATLSGSAGNLMVNASGGSHAELGDLAAGDVDVDASGGSHATVNSSGELNAVSSGGSHVRYLGSPTLGTIDADGSSSIKQE
ncbi:MAG: head GIN domain-containing protein [Anaerolineales bacterium]